ncbi:hypothetical protein N7510_008588 [Penicillium lagena]|uniref:uncharacterized protein n=1 Tax=Penicillium lagena TaxID=94218 RepID=UPI0025403321|nr:uncharacterized protein N7510_008588 [Penicillium lagena]KAJ5605807.1 hypothetical protein N7510_008588 [Penicillium lagena]
MSPTLRPLWARDISSDLSSVSSWDKCMSKTYCKWPVIVGIIVGSVIVLCILACVINCLCCGYRCCTACCGCCCPSGRRRNKQPKYYDEPPLHQPPPPSANPTYQPSPGPPAYRGQVQTARFDSSKPSARVDEDSLPAMPTWDSAVEKHVEDPNANADEVEMEPLNPQGHGLDRKGSVSPGVAYADFPPPLPTNHGESSVYRGYGPNDPYGRRSPGPGAAFGGQEDPYGHRSPGVMAPPAAVSPYGRRSPGSNAAFPGQQDPYRRPSPGPNAAFGGQQDPYRRPSPGPSAAFGGQQDPYGPRSPGGMSSPVNGAMTHNPYDTQQQQQSYHSQPYDDYNNGGNDGQFHAMTAPHAVTSPSPPRANGLLAILGDGRPGTHGSPSIGGASQYPPTYTSQPAAPYRGMSPNLPSPSPPPAGPLPSPPSQQYTAYNAASTETPPNRTPTVLQSGRNAAPGSYRNV